MSFVLYMKASVPTELQEQFNIPSVPEIYLGSEVENGVAKIVIKTVKELANNIE